MVLPEWSVIVRNYSSLGITKTLMKAYYSGIIDLIKWLMLLKSLKPESCLEICRVRIYPVHFPVTLPATINFIGVGTPAFGVPFI